MSNGDNAGVAGGVKSSTFMKESTWILYSFDVKMDGKNACRLTDKKFQNHENTADLAGVTFVVTVMVPTGSDTCPTCRTARGETNLKQTRSYEEFFSEELKAFDQLRKLFPDLAPMLPPVGGRYKVVSKPARDSAYDRFRKEKKKGGHSGSADDNHHPHPLKEGGCPIHQGVLRKPPAGTPERRKADLADQLIKRKCNAANIRNA